ncbi:hypothetical protein ACP70R_049044 [Stipagrostis hirtigluma subsp. patula]
MSTQPHEDEWPVQQTQAEDLTPDDIPTRRGVELAFVPPSQEDNQSPAPTSPTPATVVKREKATASNTAPTLMPVTVKQIKDAASEAGEGQMIINHTTVTTVRLIGRLLRSVFDESRVNFNLHDGTGEIKAAI